MAKKNNDAEGTGTKEALSPTRSITYVGPYYRKKIIAKGVGAINPKAMKEADITRMVRRHPKLARLWDGL